MGRENGRAEVRIECKDFDFGALESFQRGGDIGLGVSRVLERDMIKKIAEKLAEVPLEATELLFDLFLDSRKGQDKLTKKEFKDAILLTFKVPGI
mmetsp:Transcript_30428/g.22577  ORF Transcript_30428/g.22577 Transcript_30428/m.22577 type:complete len:95 (+) Transcript_30428:713-997(+)